MLCASAEAQAAHDWQAAPLSAAALASADPFRLDASQHVQHRDGGAAVEAPMAEPQPVSVLHHHAATSAEARTLGQVRDASTPSVQTLAAHEAVAVSDRLGRRMTTIVHPCPWCSPQHRCPPDLDVRKFI